MAAIISSKKQNVRPQQKKQKKPMLIKDFLISLSMKIGTILDQSQKSIQNLIEQLNKVTLNQNDQNTKPKITNSPNSAQKHQSKANEAALQQSQLQTNSSIRKISSKNQTQLQQKMKKLKMGELNKKRQQLMKQLRVVDKQLIQNKNLTSEIISKDQKSPTNKNSQKYELHSPLTLTSPKKPQINNKQTKKPENSKLLNESRTLQIMQNLNKQKIKRHQQMINRMQKRQQQQLKKIQELQQRRINIELKKSRLNNTLQKSASSSQPLSKIYIKNLKNPKKLKQLNINSNSLNNSNLIKDSSKKSLINNNSMMLSNLDYQQNSIKLKQGQTGKEKGKQKQNKVIKKVR